jgi:uncharacterized phage protein (TIGR02220 family)
MDDQQRGWYWQLLVESWVSDPQCSLPEDMHQLYILSGASDEANFNARSNLVLSQFTKRNGFLWHDRLLEEYAKQQFHKEKSSKGGKKSVAVKRMNRRKQMETIKSDHVTQFNPPSNLVETKTQPDTQPTTQPNVNTSSSSSSSSSTSSSSDIKGGVGGNGSHVAVEVIDYLNSKAKTSFRPVKSNLEFVHARIKEGATVDDLKAVVDFKCRDWLGKPEAKYLRPETLFNATKFNSYIGLASQQAVKQDLKSEWEAFGEVKK